MTRTMPIDKWTAFLASFAVPGAGQLLARSWWCVAWFIVAALATILSVAWLPEDLALASVCRAGLFLFLSLASAEHAKRLLEPRGPWPHISGVRSRTAWSRPRGRAVKLRLELSVPRPAADVWRRVADVERFLLIDPFHSRVVPLRPVMEVGTDLLIEHRAFGAAVHRFGRLLRWEEGRGYAFSDLSARGTDRGFPHVFFVSVEQDPQRPAAASRVVIEVRGKWTGWIPVRLGMWWLRYVVWEHARLLRTAL